MVSRRVSHQEPAHLTTRKTTSLKKKRVAAGASVVDAVEMVRRGDRAGVLQFVKERHLATGADVTLHELWLSGQAAYFCADYARAVGILDRLLTNPRAAALAPWMHVVALHRLAFAALQIGDLARATRATEDAGALVAAHATDLAPYASDVAALRAHLLELRGDFDAAFFAMERAHELSVCAGNAVRAATTASDLGRLAGILSKLTIGLTWLEKAATLAAALDDLRVSRTIELRKAMLLSQGGMPRQAEEILRALVESSASGGLEVVVDAHGRLGDILRVQGRNREAIEFLARAVRLSADNGLRRHEAYLRRDLAACLLSSPASDRTDVVREFDCAISRALEINPPQSLLLAQLGQDVLAHPGLVGREVLPPELRTALETAVRRVEQLSKVSAYQQATRSDRLGKAVKELALVLERVRGRTLRLKHTTVLLGALIAMSQGGKRSRLRASEAELLRWLLNRRTPSTPSEIADGLAISLDAANKRLGRLRAHICRDLLITRKGNARYYSVDVTDDSLSSHSATNG